MSILIGVKINCGILIHFRAFVRIFMGFLYVVVFIVIYDRCYRKQLICQMIGSENMTWDNIIKSPELGECTTRRYI